MGTEVAVVGAGGFLATSNEVMSALDAFAGDLGSGGGNFLRFDGNDGVFTFGANKDELQLGTQLAVNLTTLERGFICWKDEEVVDEIMVSMTSGAPRPSKASLPDHAPYDEGDGWQEQVIVDFKMVDSPFLDLRFKATGITKINAIGRMIKNISVGAKSNMGLIPIVEIDEQEFESKAKGARGAKKHAPDFKIVDWASADQLASLQDGGVAEGYQGEVANEEATPVPAAAVAAPVAKPAPTRAKPPAQPPVTPIAQAAPVAATATPTPAAAAAPAPVASRAAPPRRSRFS